MENKKDPNNEMIPVISWKDSERNIQKIHKHFNFHYKSMILSFETKNREFSI
jgi:hypothetical protein